MLLSDVDAVVFDKDGTLVDVQLTWGPAVVRALHDFVEDVDVRQRVAAALGLDLSTARLMPDSPIIAETNAELGARIAAVTGGRTADVTGVFDELVERYGRDTVVPLAGVDRMLSALSDAGVWVGLATNDSEGSAAGQLRSLGWAPFFDSIVGYDSGFGGKPGPGMLVASAERAGCPLERLLMVGDTATDAGAANAAGCRVVLLGEQAPEELDVTVVVASVTEIPALLGL